MSLARNWVIIVVGAVVASFDIRSSFSLEERILTFLRFHLKLIIRFHFRWSQNMRSYCRQILITIRAHRWLPWMLSCSLLYLYIEYRCVRRLRHLFESNQIFLLMLKHLIHHLSLMLWITFLNSLKHLKVILFDIIIFQVWKFCSGNICLMCKDLTRMLLNIPLKWSKIFHLIYSLLS